MRIHTALEWNIIEDSYLVLSSKTIESNITLYDFNLPVLLFIGFSDHLELVWSATTKT